LCSLYNANGLIAYQNPEGTYYYIFDDQTQFNKRKISLDVLIVSDSDNIDYTIKIVKSDIEQVVKPCKLKVLTEKDVYLFPYNEYKDDIYDPDYKIKAEFTKKEKFKTWEIIKFVVYFFVVLIGVIIGYYEDSEIIKTVALSVAGSIFVVILIDCLIKLAGWFEYTDTIKIKNLSNWIRHNPSPEIPGSEPEDSALETPSVEEDI
jgi:hypothetical protein